MTVNLFSTILDDDVITERLKNDKDLFNTDHIMGVVGPLTSDILYRMFFEDPEDSLCCVLVLEIGKEEEIEYTVNLKEQFYQKHIGKFLDNIKRKIINDIIFKFVTELEKIDWWEIDLDREEYK